MRMKGKTKFSILRNHKKDIKESVEREKIKTDFIFTISHELRTPLNIITNSSKLIKSKINKNEYEKFCMGISPLNDDAIVQRIGTRS